MNTDQRFLPVPAVDNGDGTFTLTFPANPNVLIMGHYWLFALDGDGTPSIGETVQIIRGTSAGAGAVYVSDLPWSLEVNGLGPAERDLSNGDLAAGDGNTIRLDGAPYVKGIGAHAVSQIDVDLAGLYDRFLSDIGLDDEQDEQCGNVRFEVDLDSTNVYASGNFIDASPTETIDIDVSAANTLTLRVLDGDDSSCGDHGDWADARLVPKDLPGFRFYRFRATKLRDGLTATSIQLAELSLWGDSAASATPDRSRLAAVARGNARNGSARSRDRSARGPGGRSRRTVPG